MADKDRTVRDYIRPGAEAYGRLREDFNFNDGNGDGRIDFEEFIDFMNSLDPEMAENEYRVGFEEIDADRDGLIEFGEFSAWWNQR